MLNVMRETNWLKYILWVVAIAMVAYLGSYFVGGDRGPGGDAWAARVNGEPIPTQEFLDAARKQDDLYRRLLGNQYESMRKQLRLGSQVVQSLVDNRIMLSEAKALGLEATEQEIGHRILSDPSLHDAAGVFVGRDRYVEVVNSQFPGGVAAFEQAIADEITIRKWIDLVTEPTDVADDDLERLYRSRNEKVAFDYVLIGASDLGVAKDVPEADARAWYAAHQDAYRRGEARKVRIAVVDRQSQIAKAGVTDADVKAFYDANQAEFTRPDQRRVSHILFRVDPTAKPEDKQSIRTLANSVLERVRKGEDIGALARSMSQDPGSASKGGDLGWFGKGDMVKPFEDAAFATPPGQVAPVVETEFGFHVVKVTDARAAGTSSLDEVKDAIKRNLEVQKAQQLMKTEADRVRGTITSAAEFEAAAAKSGLKVETRVVSREDPARDLGPSPDFTNAVFSTAPGQVTSPVGVARGLAIVAVDESLPPAVRPFEEVRTRVASDVVADRTRLAALASARRALPTNGDLQAAAKVLKGKVESSGDQAPGFSLPSIGRSADLEKQVFAPGSTVGSTGVAGVANGAIVYKITRHEVFDRARFEAARTTLREEALRQRRDALLQEVLAALRQKNAVEINNDVVDRANG